MLALERNQRRFVTATKRRLDELDGELHTTLIKLSDKISGILMQLNRQSLGLTEASQDQAGITRDLERRVYALESWLKEISQVRPRPGLSAVEQASNSAMMATTALAEHFEPTDLDTLIYDVFGLDAEPVEFGKTKQLKARLMVKRSISQGLFWSLVKKAKAQRPHALWPIDTGPLQ